MNLKNAWMALLAVVVLSANVNAQSRVRYSSQSRSILSSGKTKSSGRQIDYRTDRRVKRASNSYTEHVEPGRVVVESGCTSCGGGGCNTCLPRPAFRCCIPLIPQILDEVDCVLRALFACTRPSCGPHCDIRNPGQSRVLFPQFSRRKCCDNHVRSSEVWVEEGTDLQPPKVPQGLKPTPAKKDSKSAAYRSIIPSVRYGQRLSYRKGSALNYARSPRTARYQPTRRARSTARAAGRTRTQRQTTYAPQTRIKKSESARTRIKKSESVGTGIRRKPTQSLRSVNRSNIRSRIRRTSATRKEVVRKVPRRIDVDDDVKPIDKPIRTSTGRKIPVNPLR